MKKCFFIGHGNAPDRLFRPLLRRMEVLVLEHGIMEFVAGNYGNFDRLARCAAVKIKEKYPETSAMQLQVYHPSRQKTPLTKGMDGFLYPPCMEMVPPRFAISRANRYMIDHVDYIIAYVHFPGRARDLLEYARRREKQGLLQIDCMEIPGDNNTFFA